MQRYTQYAVDAFGTVYNPLTVRVIDKGTGLNAVVYSDNGVTTKTNPFTTEADGEITFYANNARYDIELTGLVSRTVDDVILFDVSDSTNIPTTLYVPSDIVITNGGSANIFTMPADRPELVMGSAYILIKQSTAAMGTIRFNLGSTGGSGDIGRAYFTAVDSAGTSYDGNKVNNSFFGFTAGGTDLPTTVKINFFLRRASGATVGEARITLTTVNSVPEPLTVQLDSWCQYVKST